MKINLDKILIACGFIGPAIFFFTIYLLFPFLYSGYDIANQTISEFGGLDSPIKTIANVFGFGLFGIFIMLFAFGLFRLKEINLPGKTGAFFIFITGILMYLTGIFNGTSDGFTKMDLFHVVASNYQFPILAVGLVLFALGISNNVKLKRMTPVILVLGLITLSLAYVFFFTHDLQNRGIWQRAAIGLPYLTMTIIAMTIYRNMK